MKKCTFSSAPESKHTIRAFVYVGDAGHERGETSLLLWLRCSQRERAHRSTMECAEEGNDVLATCVIARELECALDRFGAGVAIEELVWSRHGGNGRKLFGEVGQGLVIEIRS